MAWNINGGVFTKLEDAGLQNIFLEFDVIILLEAKIKGRQTVQIQLRLRRSFTAYNFPRKDDMTGGGILCLMKEEKWKAHMGTPISRISGTMELVIDIAVAGTTHSEDQELKTHKPLQIWGVYLPPEGSHQATAQEERQKIVEGLGPLIIQDEENTHRSWWETPTQESAIWTMPS